MSERPPELADTHVWINFKTMQVECAKCGGREDLPPLTKDAIPILEKHEQCEADE